MAPHIKGSNIKDRMFSLLQSAIYSDCDIIADDDTIKAHKFILAAVSPVFEEHFFGPFSQSNFYMPYSASITAQILKAAYQQPIYISSKREAREIRDAAEYLQMAELWKIVDNYIENSNKQTSSKHAILT
ncbi:BTB/POZ and MATH domain-containing protein 3-like [Chrysoperla carnea]|uniref:BTB/POZ and MATH domain-containing protein 3-like n=1 Tax=Chrysoperla carnea TaxID=189513 RepID=UPI001D0716A1|nr:BTB/POZ and MATH domain-containing protein 3-like [Chrysoperla carnea]